MAKSTNSDAFKLQKRIMTLTGVWPYRTSTFIYKTKGLTHHITMIIITGTLLLNAFVLEDISQLIQSWSVFFAFLNYSVKLIIFRFKKPTFLDLLDFLNSPHFTYYKEEFDQYLKRTIRFSTIMVKLFLYSSITTVTFIFSAPLLIPRYERQTPLPFPLDLKQRPIIIYLFVYVFQCCAIFSASWNNAGFDNLAPSMMGLSSGYFKILNKTIRRITDPRNQTNQNSLKEIFTSYGNFDQVVNEELCKCAEHHLAIIKFTETIEEMFTYMFLCQFLCSAAAICFVGFTLMNAAPGSLDFIFALSYLATLIIQITLYCSYGNEVTLQSSQIGDACYMTEWAHCGPLVRTTMFLIMERSKRPLFLTAGKFVNLSLESLVTIVKSAASYAAVLRQLLNK